MPRKHSQAGLTFLWILLWLAGMAAITYWCVTRHAPALQQKIQSSAQSALTATGASNVNLSVDGRTAQLSGVVASEAEQTKVVEAITSASGIRTVNNQLSIAGNTVTVPVASTANSVNITNSDDTTTTPTENTQQTTVAEQTKDAQQTSDTGVQKSDDQQPQQTEQILAGPLETDAAASQADTDSEADETLSRSQAEAQEENTEPAQTTDLTENNTVAVNDVSATDLAVNDLEVDEVAKSVEEKARALIEQARKKRDLASSQNSASADSADATDALAELPSPTPADDAGLLPSFNLKVNNDTLDLKGHISNRDNLLRLIQSAMNTFNASYVINSVQVHEDRRGADWLPALTRFIPSMQNINDASISIIESQVTLSGIANNERSHDEVVNDALSMLSTLSLVERISVAKEPASETTQASAPATSISSTTADVSDRRSQLKQAFDALEREKILFQSGSDVLTKASLESIEKMAALFAQYPNIDIEVNGHTDSSGNSSTNLRLSQLRANAVRDYLVQQGITPERLTAYGFGDGVPIADNSTSAGRQLNRRIEFNF